jgi:hypothetical protein
MVEVLVLVLLVLAMAPFRHIAGVQQVGRATRVLFEEAGGSGARTRTIRGGRSN